MRLPSHLKNFHQIIDCGAQHGANKQTQAFVQRSEKNYGFESFPPRKNMWVLHEILLPNELNMQWNPSNQRTIYIS